MEAEREREREQEIDICIAQTHLNVGHTVMREEDAEKERVEGRRERAREKETEMQQYAEDAALMRADRTN